MQKTLLDFCERSTGESEEARSSAGSSISLESGGVGQELDTNSMISEASVTCFGTCCERGRIDPNQPRTRDILDATTKIIHGQKRSVSASWFDRYSWLTLCETKNVLFCHCCVAAHRNASQSMVLFSCLRTVSLLPNSPYYNVYFDISINYTDF